MINLQDGVLVQVALPTPAIAKAVRQDPLNVIPLRADLILPGTNDVVVFPQTSPAASWIFTHNLGRKPIAMVYDALGRYVVGDVDVTDTLVTVTWAVPATGSVVLI